MIKVELTKDTEQFPEGYVLKLDDNSAAALIQRGDAKLVQDQVPVESVQSGGERARAINQAANKAAATPKQEDITDGEDA